MFKCHLCEVDFNDGARCSSCSNNFDFACAGISESGWRKRGDRKATWKCTSCKLNSPRSQIKPKTAPADMDSIPSQLKILSTQTAAIPDLVENMKSIQKELAELKSIRSDIINIKSSVQFAHNSIEELSTKVLNLSTEVESLKKTREDAISLHAKFSKLNELYIENEQRLRMNNIEIKGVPASNSEDLFLIVKKICTIINVNVPKEQVNYIARVPTRNNKDNKNIISSIHNRYLKEDFVAAARKHKITAGSLGLRGDHAIYINDHLTLQNKMLLTKAKTLAKEQGFAYVWVKGCKIFIRKNPTSPMLIIRTEQDLKKIM